uniref:OTU domain-containing protein n=1 Tax=viral metagenome TaxID=1070528 RepID=A0A6C0B367_9ZZZZ
MEKEFIKSTISTNLFIIQDVAGDNACFYRAIANYIYFAQSNNTNDLDLIKSFENWGDKNTLENIIPENVYQDELAEYLQRIILEYIKNNPDKTLPFMGNMTIKDAIPFIHNITYKEYLEYYSLCAFKEYNLGENFVIDRWGSSLEVFIVSEIIKCPIIVFNTQTWSKRYKKIINGKIIKNKPEKNVRLKPSVVVGKKYIGKRLPIYLIWREYHGNGHYMTLYPKNNTDILSAII